MEKIFLIFLFLIINDICHASDYERPQTDTCYESIEYQAESFASYISDEPPIKIDSDLYVFSNYGVEINEDLLKEEKTWYCNFLCADRAEQACGFVMACIDWSTSGAPICTGIWLLASPRLLAYCDC